MTDETQHRRTGRRAVALYLVYVLLTTAVAVLLVQMGVRGLGRPARERAFQVGASVEQTIGVGRTRRPTPTPSPSPSPTAERSARPSASPTPSRTAPPPPPPTRTPPPPPPPGRPTPSPPGPPASTPVLLYLGSGGRTTATANLPMTKTAPRTAAVRNYDSDRNGDPGLTIVRGGSGAAESDTRKIQAWSWTAPAATRVKGGAKVKVWAALPGFKGAGPGGLTAYLQHCAATCTTLGSGTVQRSSWADGAKTWVQATVELGAVDRTLRAGERLRVALVVGRDMWLAYDATAQPSSLRIG